MQLSKTIYNPYIRRADTTTKVMTDVILALIPSMIMSCLAYGFFPVAVTLVAVGSALLAEYLFAFIFSKDTKSIADGSAIVTGILLSYTLGPFTPLYVVAFGGATGVIFGKMLWGGLGRNVFNPALVGREFMTIFFPGIMKSDFIWQDKSLINIETIEITGSSFYDGLFYKVAGAIGEYSPFFLVLGGLYLLWRNRISWHIPFGMFVTFALALFLFSDHMLQFSFGGLFLGAIYMATDMPTSASNNGGKLYFGIMVAVICALCLTNGVDDGYFSFAILIMNGFVLPLNYICKPKVWGKEIEWGKRIMHLSLLTLAILIVTAIVIWADRNDWIVYFVLFYTAYMIVRFILKGGNFKWGMDKEG